MLLSPSRACLQRVAHCSLTRDHPQRTAPGHGALNSVPWSAAPPGGQSQAAPGFCCTSQSTGHTGHPLRAPPTHLSGARRPCDHKRPTLGSRGRMAGVPSFVARRSLQGTQWVGYRRVGPVPETLAGPYRPQDPVPSALESPGALGSNLRKEKSGSGIKT
ncbi:hypothetical protein VTL71DRAFT_1207 [Oculimacula yallundae]|uniref:Uncharacterized protein n=1 Tax=Oculimacula yallundae TaxID=86028 RepID=A0ABR4D4K1_9HELO